ncbi:hypothetical protein ACOJIU_17745 (plasmid) [Carnobacterium maltaromaticum]
MLSRREKIRTQKKQERKELWKDIIIPLLAVFVPVIIALVSALLQ